MPHAAAFRRLAIVALAGLASCRSGPASCGPADLVVYGRVWTGDSAHPWAGAVAVSGDTVAAVGDSAEIAGWEVGLAATADVGRTSTNDGGSSTMMVGGELAVSRLRLDAAVGRDSTLLGEEGQRITAGVGYDFGRLDTHMSYSLVESEQQATNTGLLTMGSSLALSSGVVLNGDLAIADEDGRDATTAGRVSLRLNF